MRKISNQDFSAMKFTSQRVLYLLVMSKNSCSKLHCQKLFNLKPFSYKVLALSTHRLYGALQIRVEVVGGGTAAPARHSAEGMLWVEVDVCVGWGLRVGD